MCTPYYTNAKQKDPAQLEIFSPDDIQPPLPRCPFPDLQLSKVLDEFHAHQRRIGNPNVTIPLWMVAVDLDGAPILP